MPDAAQIRHALTWAQNQLREKFILCINPQGEKRYYCVGCMSKSAPARNEIVHNSPCEYRNLELATASLAPLESDYAAPIPQSSD
jgi:hypothetical protein